MTKYIFFDDRLQKRAGGPSTYLYNLKNGLEKIDKQEINFIYNELNNDNISNSKIKKILKKIIHKFPRFYERMLMWKRQKKGYLFRELTKKIKSKDLVMFHMTSDMAKALEDLPNDCIKLLMSHSPEAASKQMASELCSKFKLSNYDFSYTEKTYFEKFDLEAFKNADIIVFPSKESMEPYYETINNFERLIANKHIEYLPTGTEKLQYNVSREDFRKKHNIPLNAFVLTFIGRHNYVKGYDIFVKICENILNKFDDVYVVTAGVGDIPSLKNKRWIDIGWTNDPGSVANAADIFILPNRRTYFDLVLIEMLSIGKVCVVSNTGGNKTMSEFSSGVLTYNNEEDAISIIEDLYDNRKKMTKYSEENLKVYEKSFTIESFAERYVNMLKKIEKS